MEKYRLLESPSGTQWMIEEQKDFKWEPIYYWQDESKNPEDHECLETVRVKKNIYLCKQEAEDKFNMLIDDIDPWIVKREG